MRAVLMRCRGIYGDYMFQESALGERIICSHLHNAVANERARNQLVPSSLPLRFNFTLDFIT